MLQKPDGSWAISDSEKSAYVADHIAWVSRSPQTSDRDNEILSNSSDLMSAESDGYLDESPFSLEELKAAINKCKLGTAHGEDGLRYEFIRQLGSDNETLLLALFNNIWTKGICPDSWKLAKITLLYKNGKDPSQPSSYRPISLTSCLCKLFERMIDTRLSHFLDVRGLIDPDQSGFRRKVSSVDAVVRLVQDVHDTWEIRSRDEHHLSGQVGAVFFLFGKSL